MPHYSFLDGPYRLSMGLRALEPHDWLEVGPDREHQMAERKRLLAERPVDVVAALPESTAAQRELLGILLEHLPLRFADLWHRVCGTLVNRETGERFSADPAEPLSMIGRMVQEDFCLLQESLAGYRLTAAALCFPAHWRLSEKLGRPLDVIHEPVPGFAERLAGPVDRFFDKLQASRPVWRVNWSLVDTPELYRPPEQRGRRRTLCAERAGEQLWLRVERQTLRRLPDSGAVLFGIRTYVEALATVTDDPAVAHALAGRVREMPPAMAAYKGIAAIREPLLEYLDRRATGLVA
jgi:Haem-dependent oxidative N-demethylase, alpha subunit-like